jgi:hypothetical protein
VLELLSRSLGCGDAVCRCWHGAEHAVGLLLRRLSAVAAIIAAVAAVEFCTIIVIPPPEHRRLAAILTTVPRRGTEVGSVVCVRSAGSGTGCCASRRRPTLMTLRLLACRRRLPAQSR